MTGWSSWMPASPTRCAACRRRRTSRPAPRSPLAGISSRARSPKCAKLRAIVTLGRIAHDTAAAALDVRRSRWYPSPMVPCHEIGRVRLFDSYHCSRYNTNTGVLTTEMFHNVFAQVA